MSRHPNRRQTTPLVAAALAAVLSGAPVPATAQTSTARVFAFDTAMKGDEEIALRWPVAVAVAADGELAAADAWQSRVLFFRDTGVTWSLSGSLELPAPPLDMILDGERFVVSLRGEPWLLALEGEGHAMRSLPLPGDAIPGALAALPGGGFLVHDLAGERLFEVSSRGSVRVRADELASPVTALAATAGGGYVAADSRRGLIRRYDASGQPVGEWVVPGNDPVPAWPAGLAFTPGGSLAISDRHGGRLVMLDAGGRLSGVGSRQGWAAGLLRFPGGLAWLPDGRLAVVDQGNGRIQVFQRVDGATVP